MARENEKRLREELLNLERQEYDSIASILSLEIQISRVLDQIIEQREVLQGIELATQREREQGRELTEEEFNQILDIIKQRKEKLKLLHSEIRAQKEYNDSLRKNTLLLKGHLQDYWGFLMDSDKAIKNLILDFGLTGNKAALVRDAIESSAVQAARLGVSIEDLTGMYKAYTDQVGRTVLLGDKQLEAMTQLAKGTGLANTEAAQLAGQFELMGMDLINTVKTVEGIMETTERMGVNTTKVLKLVGENFKRLQTYTFRQGVAGMGDLAAYAEKFKVDIGAALGAAENARKLEGAIDMGAKLQVLGGEFAKLGDPLSMLYESRNDLEAFNQRIAEMTKGMVTMNKTADGFNLQIASPMARDLLSKAAEALGMSTEQMTEMAFQQEKINRMRQEMIGSGFNKEQRELIEGMGQLNADTGSFFVMIGNKKRDIKSLTADELKLLEAEQRTLSQRAKDAQTFDDQFKIFINELKSVGLPLLQGINTVLTNYIRPSLDFLTNVFEGVSENYKGLMKTIGLVGGFIVLTGKLIPMLKLGTALVKGIAGLPATVLNAFGGKGAKLTDTLSGKGADSSMKGMVGLGVAAVGLGYGLKLAAEGVSSLANSFEKLDPEQINKLNWTIGVLGATMATVLVGGIIAIGAASAPVSVPLLALGAAAVGLGYGLKLASEGIGYMAETFTDLTKVADAGDLLKLSLGMGTFAASTTAFVNPITIAGLAVASKTISKIASYGDDMFKVGEAFRNMTVLLSGSKSDFKDIENTIKTISSINFNNSSTFSELVNLLKNPIKVEFKDKQVGFVANIDLNIDGKRAFNQLNIARNVEIKMADYLAGKSSPTRL